MKMEYAIKENKPHGFAIWEVTEEQPEPWKYYEPISPWFITHRQAEQYLLEIFTTGGLIR